MLGVKKIISKCFKNFKSKKPPKKSIPKAVRLRSWDIVYGAEAGLGTCFVCQTKTISKGEFDCSHIIAEANNGSTTNGNLIPLCGMCNRSMGKTNLVEYVNKYHPKNKDIHKILKKIREYKPPTDLLSTKKE